jgi:hypothetical protein
VYVPRQSIFLEEGNHYCFIMRDGQPQRTQVQIDVNNDNFTLVSSGVSEGDKVLLYNPLLGPGSGREEKPEEKKATPPTTPPAMPVGTPVAAGP